MIPKSDSGVSILIASEHRIEEHILRIYTYNERFIEREHIRYEVGGLRGCNSRIILLMKIISESECI